MIYALLSKKCHESHLRTCMGQIAQDAWIGVGRGAQPNLGNACIMGKNYPAISALRDAYFHFRDKIENWHNWISCFEMKRRASYFQSRTLRREREFSHPISGFETRLRNSVIFSRDSRRDWEAFPVIFSFYQHFCKKWHRYASSWCCLIFCSLIALHDIA